MKDDGKTGSKCHSGRFWTAVFSRPSDPSGRGEDTGEKRFPQESLEILIPGFRVPRGPVVLLLILGVLVAASYSPALQAEFVWDDFLLTKLKAVSSWEGIWQLWFDPATAYLQRDAVEGHYWPLLYTTFWLDHKLWGFHPLGYHVFNLLLHFTNTVLLWRLLLRLGVPGAFFAAAVFAVHPLHVESVAWVISRKDLLSALFYLSAFLMWMRFIETPRPRCYVAALLLFAAALLCKSVAITLPAALLIFQWWCKDRVTPRDFILTAPFFLVGLIVGGFDTWFYKTKTALSFDYSVYERVLIASRALWFYVEKLLWPVDLAVIYPPWEIDAADPVGWVYVVATAAVALAFWTLRHRIGRGPLACALFFAVTLSPTLGFVDYSYMGHSFVADRYQYLAGIGVIILFAAAATRGVQRLPSVSSRSAAKGVALGLLALLGVATWDQTGVYKSDVSLFKHVISFNPQSWAAHQNLGMALLRLNEFEEAESHLRRSLEIFPLNPKAFRNLGDALRGRERYEESLKWYRAAVNLEPDEPLNHAGMGTVFFQLELYEEAVSNMRRALEIQPDFSTAPGIHSLIGQGLRNMGRHGEADKHFDLSVELGMEMNPRDPGVLFSQAEDLRGRKLYQESLKWYLSAVELDPDFALAYAGMGDSLYQLGRYLEAVSSMKRTLELQPDFPMAPTLRYLIAQALGKMGPSHDVQDQVDRTMQNGSGDARTFFSLAENLREQKRYEEVLELYRDLIRTDPDFALAYAGMGDSLYQLGRYEEAVS
ncbi:MAG: tetratricopeptide repeat protein, partial [Candidatus Dadabacteria bacterium]|nr:tetratricopeptide repeat protein [Candidatus Dadabacteria bacterium]